MPSSALVPRPLSPMLHNAVDQWAQAATAAGISKRAQRIRDKVRALVGDGIDPKHQTPAPLGFFVYVGLPVQDVTPSDVARWITYLQECGLAPSTVYWMVSKVSAFYDWLLAEPQFSAHLVGNPVKMVRPKAPRPYQSDKTQALSDQQARCLLETVKARADTGDLVGMRDYALLRLYFVTGKRRTEIIRLCWRDLAWQDALVITTLLKGGERRSFEVRDEATIQALVDYLNASGRLDTMQPDSPLWIRHDRAAPAESPITSHGFVRNLKRYALDAGIGDVHLHQTRHTFARMAGDETGDMGAVQDGLDHLNRATTAVYLRRVSIKRDRWSEGIARRLDG